MHTYGSYSTENVPVQNLIECQGIGHRLSSKIRICVDKTLVKDSLCIPSSMHLGGQNHNCSAEVLPLETLTILSGEDAGTSILKESYSQPIITTLQQNPHKAQAIRRTPS
jgi:hypothetical protein